LYVLGVITGLGVNRWYMAESYKAIMWALIALGAFLGALWIAVQWMGPAGGT